jgi:hypothetical protein
MSARIAIVAYRCEVAGVASDSLDIQVRYFEDTSIDIPTFLREEPTQSYSNDLDELVTWPFVAVPFVAVLAIEDFGSPKNGSEVAGFVVDCMEFPKWGEKTMPLSGHSRLAGTVDTGSPTHSGGNRPRAQAMTIPR